MASFMGPIAFPYRARSDCQATGRRELFFNE